MFNHFFRTLLVISLKNWLLNGFIIFRYRKLNLFIDYGVQLRSVVFGRDVSIFRKCSLSSVKIDRGSFVSENTSLSNLEIGCFCSIGPDCRIGLGIHPSKNFVSSHPAFYSNNPLLSRYYCDGAEYFKEFKKIVIENDVWIGAGVCVLDGVNISNGVIVAAGSVVTKDVPPYAVVGGVPARIIKYRFDQDYIEVLQKSKWWERDDLWLSKNFKKFHDIKDFQNLLLKEKK